MLGAIAGDIIGSRFEGHSGPPVGFELFHPDCRFTDDTVCTLAVAEALLTGHGFAHALRRFVRRHPAAGYGGMFRRWAFAEGAPAYGSWGNGAPMRVAAVGWWAASEDEARALARSQAAVTHDHPDAVAAAQAVALTILRLRRGMAPDAVRDRVSAEFGYALEAEAALRGGGFDVSAAGTVPPALTAAFEARDWEEAVRAAVGLGGDTDTLACIASATAPAIHGLPDAIAREARDRLTEDLRAVLLRFDEASDPGPGNRRQS